MALPHGQTTYQIGKEAAGRGIFMKNKVMVFLALIVGIIIGLIVPHIFYSGLNSSWQELRTKPKHFGVSYSAQAVFNDLPMPEIKSVTGKAKFIENKDQNVELGFIINVDMAGLDMTKVPQRYKVEKDEDIEGFKITSMPIKKAYYEIEFVFDLKDKDGFTLQKLTAKDLHSLLSGTNNLFQAKIEGVNYDAASKTHEIWVYPTITKCDSCLPAQK
jgi:hypothetical protein